MASLTKTLPKNVMTSKEDGRRLVWDDPKLDGRRSSDTFVWGYRTPGMEEILVDHPRVSMLVESTKGQFQDLMPHVVYKACREIEERCSDFDLYDAFETLALRRGYIKQYGVGKGGNRTTQIFHQHHARIIRKQWEWGQYFQHCPSRKAASDFCGTAQVTMIQMERYLVKQTRDPSIELVVKRNKGR